jgi:hypothetical protein
MATRNSSLKILPAHIGPSSSVTLPGKRPEQPHPSKDDGDSGTKNYTHKNTMKITDKSLAKTLHISLPT